MSSPSGSYYTALDNGKDGREDSSAVPLISTAQASKQSNDRSVSVVRFDDDGTMITIDNDMSRVKLSSFSQLAV